MNDTSHLFPQDEAAVYRIRVDGPITERISDWFEDMTITTECRADGKIISCLTGILTDQAALHGLLSRLYALGFLVISVKRVE